MRVKSSGLAPRFANARPPGSAKFANAPPLGLGSAQLELTDALHDYFFKYKRPVSQIQWNEKEDVYSDFQEKGAQFPKMLILLGAK